MSKIGTEIIVGQIFKPIVTTFTYDELKNYRDNDISIGINNAVIFSIPQQGLDNDSSVDAHEETSIWATDNSGLLCPLSFPYSMIAKIKDSLDRYEENTNAKKIVSVNWTKTQGTSEAGTSPNINIKVEVKYANDRTALLNVTGIKVYKNPQFTEEYVTVIAGGETINWYDRAGIYYLQGLVTDTSTGSIMATTNELPLEWTITEIEMQIPVCTSNVKIHNDSYYAEITLSADVPGMFEITEHSEGNLDTNFGRITRSNGITTFNLYNESYNTINPIIKYTFTPDNTKYYLDVNGSLNIGSISGKPIPYTCYWYVGTVIPTADNISTIGTLETNRPHWVEKSIAATNNTGESSYIYYCFAAELNVIVLDSDKETEMSLAAVSTFNYDGKTYIVQRTGRKISNGRTKDYYAKC